MSWQRHRWSPICDPPRDLVRPVRVDPTGELGPTKRQASGRYWRQTTQGFYVPVEVSDEIPEQRVLEQSMLLPTGGAVTGWAALRYHGGNFFDGLRPDGHTRMPVPLNVPPSHTFRRRQGVVFSQDRLDAAEMVNILGVPVTREERALFDEMRHADDLREAVVPMDMAAAAQLTSIRRTRAYTLQHPGWRGAPLVRAALELADELSRSPNETRMRLVWQLDAGFPKPLVNRPVWNRAGRLLGYADILDPEAGVVGEYDGADHRTAHRHSKDVDREAGFRDHGLEFFRVTGPDLPDRQLVVRRMASTRARARWLAEENRLWTLDPPPGWRAEPTLDSILDQRDFLRELHATWERERPS